MKKLLAVLLTVVLTGAAVLMTGCGSDGGSEVNDKEILVVSFGTSYNESRNITIGAIEAAISEAYPDYNVHRAFTAQTIIDILAERDGVTIDNVQEALDRAVANGVKTLIVQPTHLMNGLEYSDLKAELENYQDKFETLKLAEPLLTSDEDYDAVIEAITTATKAYDDGNTAICYMGHGTEAESNQIYSTLQEKLSDAGYDNYFIGTVEATPDLDDVLEGVKGGSYSKVVLLPLMVVAGDHATNDMAGDEEDSWKSAFEDAGYDVTCVLEGLGQNYDIQKIYVDHVKAAIDGE